MALLGKTPTITNVTLTTQNTEYSTTLPTGTKKFMVQCRTDNDIKLAFTENGSGTTYFTLKEGSGIGEDNLNTASGLTLYLQSPTAGVVAEILSWATD